MALSYGKCMERLLLSLPSALAPSSHVSRARTIFIWSPRAGRTGVHNAGDRICTGHRRSHCLQPWHSHGTFAHPSAHPASPILANGAMRCPLTLCLSGHDHIPASFTLDAVLLYHDSSTAVRSGDKHLPSPRQRHIGNSLSQ